jgi:hypothetical protein
MGRKRSRDRERINVSEKTANGRAKQQEEVTGDDDNN